MATAELRAHLRIASEGFAIVTFDDGRKIEARVRDISLGGAYLVCVSRRESDRGDGPSPELGSEVEVYLFHQGHAADAVTVDATIIRAEASGAGFVIRFAPSASPTTSPALLAKIEREAKRQGIAARNLHLRAPRASVMGWAFGWVGRAAVVGLLVGGMQILVDWLDVML